MRHGARHREKATLNGESVFTLGYPDQSEAYKPGADGKKPKYSPTNLAIAPNGDLYVGDGYGSSYINQYNSKGEYIRTFGGKGKEAGHLDCPHGIIVDLRGGTPILTVADRGNARIQRFTLDGKHLDFVGGTNMPCHFNFFKNGDVVVPDLGARVTLLDKHNQVILHLGDDSASPWRDTRKLSRDHFTPGKFVVSPRRMLRPQGQHLRGGMGGSRPSDQVAQGVGQTIAFCGLSATEAVADDVNRSFVL